jgi:hypothetical protein
MNRRLERVGHYFGGRFVSRIVTDIDYLANVVRYIHLNPLEIDGIDLPADYRWSSHRTYLGLRPAPQWFETRTVAGWFADPSAFDRFVCAPLTAGLTPSIRPVDPDDLIDTIDLVLTERSAVRARALMAQRRAVVLAIAEIAPERSDNEIFTALGIRSAGARRAARHRARRLMVTDPTIAELVARTQLLFASSLDDPEPSAA